MVDVRTARVENVPAIRAVASEAWHAAYGDVLPESAIEERLAEWYSPEAVERAVTAEETVYLVAVDDGAVGYASGAAGSEGGPETATLTSIYVHPNRWGRGIGGQLLEDLCGRLREREFERLRAVVLSENDIGLSFYEREGFEQVEERTGEHGEAEEMEVVVERPL